MLEFKLPLISAYETKELKGSERFSTKMKMRIPLLILLVSMITVSAYFPVNQNVTLQNNRFQYTFSAIAEYAAFASSVLDIEYGADAHFNSPLSFTDIDTGISYNSLLDFCDPANNTTLHEIFGSRNGEVSLLALSQIPMPLILKNTVALISRNCPGNLTCNNGMCPCGLEYQVSPGLPQLVSGTQFNTITGISVDNNILMFTSNAYGINSEGLLYYDYSGLAPTIYLVFPSLNPAAKYGLEFSYPNTVYVEDYSGTRGVFVYNLQNNTLFNLASGNYTSGQFYDSDPDIDESGRFIVWQHNVGLPPFQASYIYYYDLGADLLPGSSDDLGPTPLFTTGTAKMPKVTTLTQSPSLVSVVYQIYLWPGGPLFPTPYLYKTNVQYSPTFTLPYSINASTVSAVKPVLGSIQNHDISGNNIAIVYNSPTGNYFFAHKSQNLGVYAYDQTIPLPANSVIQKYDDGKIALGQLPVGPFPPTLYVNSRVYDPTTRRFVDPTADQQITYLPYTSDAIDIEYNPVSNTTEIYYIKDVLGLGTYSPAIFKTFMSYC